jgi:hypothetical protein
MVFKIECFFGIVDIRILHRIKLFINHFNLLIDLFLKHDNLFSLPQGIKCFHLRFIFLLFIIFKNNCLLLNINLFFNQTFSVIHNWR